LLYNKEGTKGWVGRSIDRSGVIGAKKWVLFDDGTFRPVAVFQSSLLGLKPLRKRGHRKRRKLANEKEKKRRN